MSSAIIRGMQVAPDYPGGKKSTERADSCMDVLDAATVSGGVHSDHARGREAMLQQYVIAARRISEECLFCCA